MKNVLLSIDFNIVTWNGVRKFVVMIDNSEILDLNRRTGCLREVNLHRNLVQRFIRSPFVTIWAPKAPKTRRTASDGSDTENSRRRPSLDLRTRSVLDLSEKHGRVPGTGNLKLASSRGILEADESRNEASLKRNSTVVDFFSDIPEASPQKALLKKRRLQNLIKPIRSIFSTPQSFDCRVRRQSRVSGMSDISDEHSQDQRLPYEQRAEYSGSTYRPVSSEIQRWDSFTDTASVNSGQIGEDQEHESKDMAFNRGGTSEIENNQDTRAPAASNSSVSALSLPGVPNLETVPDGENNREAADDGVPAVFTQGSPSPAGSDSASETGHVAAMDYQGTPDLTVTGSNLAPIRVGVEQVHEHACGDFIQRSQSSTESSPILSTDPIRSSDETMQMVSSWLNNNDLTVVQPEEDLGVAAENPEGVSLLSGDAPGTSTCAAAPRGTSHAGEFSANPQESRWTNIPSLANGTADQREYTFIETLGLATLAVLSAVCMHYLPQYFSRSYFYFR